MKKFEKKRGPRAAQPRSTATTTSKVVNGVPSSSDESTAIVLRPDEANENVEVDLRTERHSQAIDSQARVMAVFGEMFDSLERLATRSVEISMERSRKLGVDPGPVFEPVFCKCITEEGESSLTQDAYLELRSRAHEFDMMVDPYRSLAICRAEDQSIRTEELILSEYEMLREYIESRCVLRPWETKIGGRSSEGAARKTFENARRKVDISLSRYRWRAFTLYKRQPKAMNAFQFNPPEGFRFCLIVPPE